MKQHLSGIRLRLAVLLAVTLLLLLAVACARLICSFDPDAHNYAAVLQPPGGAHPLGTDRYGRDLLARVLAGGQVSIFSALALVGITTLAGTAAGMLCGWFGGAADTVVMRLADLCLAFPGLVLALALTAALGGGTFHAVLALAVAGWPKYARLARTRTLALRDAPFVDAARMAGGGSMQILCRHLLPNLLGPVLVTAALDVGTMMMELAGLSFLGLGAQPPAAEWGSMMSDGRSMLQSYPWVVLAPGGAIFVTVSLFHLLGDTLRDLLDPGSR